MQDRKKCRKKVSQGFTKKKKFAGEKKYDTH